jgi:hypothetical protein
MKHLWGSKLLRSKQPPLWLLVGIAATVAVLMLASLGPAGASRLFQSEEASSVPVELPTDTPEAVDTPATPAASQPTAAAGQPTTAGATGQPGAATTAAPKPTPALPTAVQPTSAQSTPVQVTPQPTTVGVAATYTPIAKPSSATGGPAPVVWIIVGLVIVALVVVIIVSPGRKPKSTE